MEEDRALLRRLAAEHKGLLAAVKELRADVDALLRCQRSQHVPAGDRPGVQAGAAFEGILQEEPLATRIYASAGQMAWSASRRASRKSRQHATAVRREKVLVAGGSLVHSPNSKNELHLSLEVLDVRSGKWEAPRQMPAPISGSGAAVLGGHVYVCGGLTSKSQGVLRYHPVMESWNSMPDLKVPRANCAAAALGGYLYAFGGHGFVGSEVWKSVERLNLSSKDRHQFEWVVLPGMCEHRAFHPAVAFQQGIYVCGGLNVPLRHSGDADMEVARSAEFLSIASGKCEPLPKMAVPRAHHAATAVDGKLVVTGGGTPGMKRSLSSVEVYEPLAMCWTMSPSMGMPMTRGSHVAVCVAGKLYIMGGGHEDIPRSDAERSAQCFDPESLTWKKVAPMAFRRAAVCGVVLDMGPCSVE